MISPGRKRTKSFLISQLDSKNEERFDYTDSEFDITFEKQASESPLKFNDFMDTLVGRKKLLAEAEEYDKARGIFVSKNETEQKEDLSSPTLKEQNQNMNLATESAPSDRRISSVEYPRSNKLMQFNDSSAQVNATPYIPNPTGTSIEDHLLVQSTPLSKSKPSSNNTQPRDILKEKLLDNHRQSISDAGSEKKPNDLKEELSKFKDDISNIDKIRYEQKQEIEQLKDILSGKDEELSQLKDILCGRDKELSQLKNELSILARNEEDHKIVIQEANKTKQNITRDLNDALKRLKKEFEMKEKSYDKKILEMKTELAGFKEQQTILSTNVNESETLIEKLRNDMNEKENQLQTARNSLSDVKDHVKKIDLEKEALSTDLLKAKGEIDDLREKLDQKNDIEKENEHLRSELSDFKAKYNSLQSTISKFSIFDINIGEKLISLHSKKKDLQNCSKLVLNSDIVGFKTKNDSNYLENLKVLIETELKPSLKEKSEEISALSKELESRNAKITSLLDRVTSIQKSKEELMSQHEALLTELSSVKEKNNSSELAAQVDTFKSLADRNLELLETINNLREDLLSASTKLKTANEMIEKERGTTLLLKESNTVLENSLSKLRKSYEKARGNTNERITPETLLKIHTHMNKASYQRLELDSVENLNLVECQNAIKNIVAILDIPYSKISAKLPLINIMLRYEKTICFHFANRIHNLLFHQEIDAKTYTKKALENYWVHRNAKMIHHPLDQCLNDLYKAVSEKLLL